MPGGFLPPEPPTRTNGLAITSLIFGIVGLAKSKTYRSGKVMSCIGIVLSILWIIPIAGLAPLIAKATDSGCRAVESKIAALNPKIDKDNGNPEAFKADLKTMIVDLQDGATRTHSDSARAAMNAMASDVQQVFNALNGNGTADTALGRLDSDGNAIDTACGHN